MNSDVILNNKPWTTIRFGIGILFLIAGLSAFLANTEDLGLSDYAICLTFILLGVFNMTNDFGVSRIIIRAENDTLVIKWLNMFRPTLIDNSSISSFILQRASIIIVRNNRRPLRLRLNSLQKRQRNLVYGFFLDYSKAKNIPVEREYHDYYKKIVV
jgi:hypothetical protein